MATINTDLVFASTPQYGDMAASLASGISSYYNAKEMEGAKEESEMLLKQRENELWASNKERWTEYAKSGFVSPQNVTDWIAMGQEEGIYEDSTAQMMRNEVGNIIDSEEYANITHLLDTANGTRKANTGLQSRMAELDAEMASYENMPITPMVQIRMSEINSEKQTLSTKIANNNASLAGLEEGLQMSSDNAMEEYSTQIMGGIQGWLDEVVSSTADIEEIRLGTPKVLYSIDDGEVKEKIVAAESDYISSVGSGEWSTREPVKETFFDADGGEHFMFPEEAMDKGYTTDKPTVVEGDVTGGYTGLAGQFFQAKGRAPKDAEELAAYRATIYPEDQETISITSEGITMTKGIAPEDMGIAAKNALEQKIVQTNEAIGRLGEIQGSFKPEYLEAPTRLQTEISSFKAKLGRGESLTEDQQSELSNITAFRQDAFTNLNKTLNELSGAAVNQHEYERLLNQLPDPGKSGFTGILTGDDPIEFKRKMDESMATMKLANSRLMYMRQNGLMPSTDTAGNAVGFFDTDGSPIALDDMPSIIDNRGEELYSQYKQQFPDMSDAEITAMTGSAIKREFGL
jgi:hypothetical protein